MKRHLFQRGFTLIEIMVVLIIIGLLAAVIVPAVMDRPDEARQIKARQDIRALVSALKLYRLDTYRYPNQAEGLEALVRAPSGSEASRWKGPYIETLPVDPWGQPYQYRNPGNQMPSFDVFTYAADNLEGGEGVNADIGNWNLNQ